MSETPLELSKPPRVPILHSPLPWPDGAHPAEMVAMNLRHVLAVVARLDAKGVGTIRAWIEYAYDVSVRVVALVHATCPTSCEDLSALAGLAEGRTDKLKFFVRPLTHWGEELTWVRLDYGRDSPPLLWISAAGNLGLDRPEPHNGHMLLTPDAGMDEQFVTWYSGVEALSVPLDQRTSAIPSLVPAQGTIEGRLAWEAYVEKCRTATTAPTPVDRGPEANSKCDSAPNNSPKDTPEKIAEEVRKETGIPRPDPLVSIVSQLFQKGLHVTLDKGSRIPPLEVPINAQLFGIDRVRQRGVILRRVEYNISILDEKINKELEKHRKAASELLPKFTYALADGNRWMPLSAKALYESELKKAEEAGSKTLRAVIGANAKAFVATKRDIVSKAAQQHYQEFNPGQQISEEDIQKILDALESRFDKALTRKFVPELSEVGTTFRAPRAGDSDANWAVAL